MGKVAYSLVLVGLLSTSALAGMTTISSPAFAVEYDHEQILEGVYGGDFALAGADYLGGGPASEIDALRHDDIFSPAGFVDAISGVPGSSADVVWSDGLVIAKAVARFAGYSQQFGFDRGLGFEPLFDATGWGTAVSGAAAVDLQGETWRWVRRNDDGSNSFSSDPALNGDGLDHMVTYQITGLDRPGTTWLLFWEDVSGPHTSEGGLSDRDFNDLVVEVVAVPEPASLAPFALGGLMILRRKRR